MRLKNIRLAGFKSFVDPTNIPFPGDMTAVVGPNGCGKSNVIDAVRWVLGESSAKNLRGEAMTDVIFNGSSARKPVSQCSVELVFDNSSGRIAGEFANYTELSVKRIVTKDAVSSYHLNGAKCRRRDITDIFLGTGLGPRSYAIIEQGMISRLIESKPQELRVFIEEAAGISRYKERRRETLNRISHTKDNLLRLDDVRHELGEQLAKLKRQAIAANRYKELKAQERDLKGQLATLRWLFQSELVQQSDNIIDTHQLDLAALLISKQGDESNLQALKNDQTIVKQNLVDAQQDIYRLGNDITKLEQSQLFARKRSSQIQAEMSLLLQQIEQVQSQLTGIDQELVSSTALIKEIEPERIIIQEHLEALLLKQDIYQDKNKAVFSALKQAEDGYYKNRQVLQQKHSQLQQTISLQQRTESRLLELAAELKDMRQYDVGKSKQLMAQLTVLSVELDQVIHRQKQATEHYLDAQGELEKADKLAGDSTIKCIQTQAELSALETLQSANTDLIPEYVKARSCQQSWQAFHAHKGYEKALETALSLFANAVVVESLSLQDVLLLNQHGPQPILLSDSFTEDKREDSLASYVLEKSVPSLFNAILVAQSTTNIAAWLAKLQPGEFLILQSGEMLSPDMFVSVEKPTDGKIMRASRIKRLQQTLEHLNAEQVKRSGQLRYAQQRLKQTQQAKADIEELLNAKQGSYALLNRDLENAKMRESQNSFIKQRINADIDTQNESLSQEQMRCETLTYEIEDQRIALALLEEQKSDAESDKQALDGQLQLVTSQLQQTQQRLHEHALNHQRLQNSYQILQEQRQNKQAQCLDNEEKILLLQDEAENLLLPNEQQQATLQQMLKAKEGFEHAKSINLQNLSELDEQIIAIQRSKTGIYEKVDRINRQIETERLRAQTAKVKAQSFIEQLAEMKLNVREVLDNLPEGAQEKDHQQALDNISGSLSRLGAVNLAAVDEYDEQVVRKQHLDTQDADLTAALETLEGAMRKIDKETRARFRHTFDQVNADLKTLFPIVFGGGSAYLALTEDNLLDTGVTIMARPPGKKNTTIALLSGGEKALTALSLVFAIFRLNPAPFCLLDEVDAPLDDANVGRFCKLVSQMSKTVQFIYITHNKIAMEMATHLTGVTMAEPGVSRMVAVDMEQALAIAE